MAGLLTHSDFLLPSHRITYMTVACVTKSILSGLSGSELTAAETVADFHGIPSLVAKVLRKTPMNQFGYKVIEYLRQKKLLKDLKCVPTYFFTTRKQNHSP